MEYYPVKFEENDFTEKGRRTIGNLYKSLRKDIINSEDSDSDKNEALDRLYNFLRAYKFESIKN